MPVPIRCSMNNPIFDRLLLQPANRPVLMKKWGCAQVHTSIDTTNIYAEISLKMKAEAMALCDVEEPDPGRHWKEDRDLMAFLNSY